METFGSLDILVNNDGILNTSPTQELEVDAWERTLSINRKDAFICCKAVLPIMEAHG